MYSSSDTLLQAQQQAAMQRHQIRMAAANAIRDISNETYLNRIQTSDRHQGAVNNQFKGFY